MWTPTCARAVLTQRRDHPLTVSKALRRPLLDEKEDPCGSVVVSEAGPLDAAEKFAVTDPYVAQKIFATYEVFETKQVSGLKADREEARGGLDYERKCVVPELIEVLQLMQLRANGFDFHAVQYQN